MRKDKFGSYEDRFCSFSKSIEKIFMVLIAGLVITLISSQLLLTSNTFRHWFVEVDRLEGVAS